VFGRCRLCAEWPPGFTLARSAVWLDAGAREAVHALKYGGLPRIATDLAAAMVGLDVPGLDSSLLVPVPAGRARLRDAATIRVSAWRAPWVAAGGARWSTCWFARGTPSRKRR